MRRTFAWALGALAFGWMIPSAPAQSYGYPQYPTYGYGYGYQPAPVYRVMPAQYYPAPMQQGNYYGRYQQPLPPAYRPAPMYMPRPVYVNSAPGNVVVNPTSARPSEPMVIIPEAGSSTTTLPATSMILRALPAGPGTTTTTQDPLPPPSVPASIPGVVTEDCHDACGPAYQPVYVPPSRQACPDKWDRDPEPACHWMAGGGALYVRPNYANRTAFATVDLANITTTPQTSTTEFHSDWEVAPYGWVAFITKSGLGVRARAWSLHQNESVIQTANSVAIVINNSPDIVNLGSPTLGSLVLPGEILSATNTLRMVVADVEAIYQINDGPWSFLASTGARWAEMRQSRTGVIVGFGGPRAGAFANHNFDGIGPTVALEASYGFSKHFALYVNGRGSALIGTHRLDNSSQQVSSTSETDWLPVLEVEAGVQCSVLCGHTTNLVVRAGLTTQSWIDAGSSISRSGNLQLVGGVLQFGFAY